METTQLRDVLGPLLHSVLSLVNMREWINAWEVYAARGLVDPNPQQHTPDPDWAEEEEASELGLGLGSEESGVRAGKEGEGQQESGEGLDPKEGPSGGN